MENFVRYKQGEKKKMKRFFLILCMLICGTVIFANNINFDFVLGFQSDIMYGKETESAVEAILLSDDISVQAGFFGYVDRVGFGALIDGGISIFGLGLQQGGFTAFPLNYGLSAVIEFKINEKHRINFSLCTRNIVVKKAKNSNDKDIELDMKFSFPKVKLEYLYLFENLKYCTGGLVFGVNYAIVSGLEKDSEKYRLEHLNPVGFNFGCRYYF